MADINISKTGAVQPPMQVKSDKTAAPPPENKEAKPTPPAMAGDAFSTKDLPATGKSMQTVSLAAPIEDAPPKSGPKPVTERKGTLAIGWGYGRQFYTPSDMHFTGADHNFTLTGVKATDRPSPFDFNTYFNPTKLSIPQYMMDITYFPTNNIYLDFNPNHHMKWVHEGDQMVQIHGTIDPELSPEMAGEYNGEYVHIRDITGGKALEHSDGYNYSHVGVGVIHPLWASNNGKHAVSVKGGLHAGGIITKTNAHLFGKGADHPFKLVGFGYGTKAGVRVDLFRNFFVEGNTEFMRGHLKGFQTDGDPGSSGAQNINTINNYFTLGYQNSLDRFFRPFKKD